MNIKIIVNPHAGEGRARNVGFSVEKFLCERCIEYSLDSTYRPGGATALAKKATQNGFNLIIAVGGDGTVNEVANGMIGTGSSLAIIPSGKKNDLARAIGLPLNNINDACQIALAKSSLNMDVGKINNKYFLNGVEFGLSANFNFLRGNFGKMIKLISMMTRYNAPDIKIKMGEVIKESKTLFLTISNGGYSGGGFHVAPNADFGDRLFDVCIAKFPGKAKFIYHIPKIFKGKHTNLPYFSFLKTPVLEVDCINPISVTYDGETMEDRAPYKINIADNRLSVKTA